MYGPMEIVLSDRAFVGIVLSSVEVFKRECLGALFGVQSRGQIFVELAIPFQSAERTFSEVRPNLKREKKINEMIPKLIAIEKIGYFHSHPQFGDVKGITALSYTDKSSMIETEIEIVVAINKSARNVWWRESNKELIGGLGGFSIKLAGYYREKDTIHKHRIVCPYAVGFDQAFCNREK